MLFRKLIELLFRMKSIPKIKILLVLLLMISVAIGADDAGNWIGSFSSEDYEDFLEPVEKKNLLLLADGKIEKGGSPQIYPIYRFFLNIRNWKTSQPGNFIYF